jgi:hypothetical protein
MRLIQAIVLAIVSAIVASAVAYFAVVRPKVRSWGFDPEEAELPIPGDDLIAEPSATETRGIDIDAPVNKVWPWLVQMGFGRGGWYSYEKLDSTGKSADEILPEFQTLNPGDIMHIDPISGFEVKVVEPEKALVLYTDSELAKNQAEKAATEATTEEQRAAASRVSGMMSGSSYPDFGATWAFYLEPTADGKTRLIERFRVKTPGNGPAKPVLGEIMGTGIVLLTRKQMIGIKERVERTEYGIPSGDVFAEQTSEPIDELAAATAS